MRSTKYGMGNSTMIDSDKITMLFVVAGVIQFLGASILFWMFSNLVVSARETEKNTRKATVLLTVLANKQGATQEDVTAATAR